MGIEERRAREFQRRERSILSAALSLAGGEDWPSVTIDQIAEKAEIGKGTVYKHFRSKDEVCARIVTDHLQVMVEKLRAVDPAMDYVPRVKTVLKTIWRHDLDHPELLALSRYCEFSEHSLNLGESVAGGFAGVKEEFKGYLMTMVQEGIDRGIIPAQPLNYLLAAGWATSIGAIRLIGEGLHFPELTADDGFLDYLADYVVKGLMNAAAPHPAA